MAYQDILVNLVNSLPEIYGAFIYNDQQGVLQSREKRATNNLQKHQVGKVFSKVFFMMSMHFQDINSIRFNYSKMTLHGGRFGNNNYLVVFCGKDIASGMTRITVQMALNNLQENLASSDLQTAPVNVPEETPEQLQQPESHLAEPLAQIKQELAKQVGPVANVLFEDTLETWVKQNKPSYETLPQLIELLVQEIGEGDEGTAFRNSARKAF